MLISNWCSYVCSSDRVARATPEARAVDWLLRQRDPDFTDWDGFADWLAENEAHAAIYDAVASLDRELDALPSASAPSVVILPDAPRRPSRRAWFGGAMAAAIVGMVSVSRSEEHTSELQSLMRISYAVFCLKKKRKKQNYYI